MRWPTGVCRAEAGIVFHPIGVVRMRHTRPQDTHALLEALASTGVLPAEDWLQQVLGTERRS